MSASDFVKNEINNRVRSGIAVSNDIRNVRNTTIGGYRSTHASQTFRFGLASGNIYVIGDSNNYIVQ